MAETTPAIEGTKNPLKSPSYPRRIHVRERAHWQGVLASWRQKVEQALAGSAGYASDPAKARMAAQMQGSLDQIADSAKRMPTEVGDLYEEDLHKLEEAVAALERTFARWNGSPA